MNIWNNTIKYLYLCLLKYLNLQTNIVSNYTEFSTGLKKYPDTLENSQETLIIKRGSGKGTVLISLAGYNSIMETLHLLSSRENANGLFESIKQIKTGRKVKHNLVED
jgi:antitoxin YefM